MRSMGGSRSEIGLDDGRVEVTSAGVPSAITRPRSSTVMRSASEVTRPTSCSTRRIVVPSRRSSPISSASSCRSWARSPDAGSSSSSTRGCPASARATWSRRCMPSGSPSAGREAQSSRPTRPRHSSAWARIARSSRRCDGGRSAAATTPARVCACAPTITLASRLIPGKMRAPWKTIPTPSRARACAGSRSIRLPDRLIVPLSGRMWPAIRLKRVDLPAPFGPMMPRSSPSATSRVTSWLAKTPPKRRDTRSTVSMTPSLPCSPSADDHSGRSVSNRASE